LTLEGSRTPYGLENKTRGDNMKIKVSLVLISLVSMTGISANKQAVAKAQAECKQKQAETLKKELQDCKDQGRSKGCAKAANNSYKNEIKNYCNKIKAEDIRPPETAAPAAPETSTPQ
jgi:hypothetical protein